MIQSANSFHLIGSHLLTALPRLWLANLSAYWVGVAEWAGFVCIKLYFFMSRTLNSLLSLFFIEFLHLFGSHAHVYFHNWVTQQFNSKELQNTCLTGISETVLRKHRHLTLCHICFYSWKSGVRIFWIGGLISLENSVLGISEFRGRWKGSWPSEATLWL